MASFGIIGLVAITFGSVVAPFLFGDSDRPSDASQTPATSAPTTTPAALIRPLSIRPVVDARQATPEQCRPEPAPPPSASGAPEFLCDLDRKARYQLGPVGLQLNLINATSAQVPLTNYYGVQIAMDPGSSAAFAQYTGANLGKQLAFVRDGVVLAAPKISTPIDGASIQLSGELTAAAAETIARMLREGT